MCEPQAHTRAPLWASGSRARRGCVHDARAYAPVNAAKARRRRFAQRRRATSDGVLARELHPQSMYLSTSPSTSSIVNRQARPSPSPCSSPSLATRPLASAPVPARVRIRPPSPRPARSAPTPIPPLLPPLQGPPVLWRCRPRTLDPTPRPVNHLYSVGQPRG